MSTVTDRPTAAAAPGEPGRRPGGVVGWITTTDHKRIGILYCVTSFAFFLIGGALAGVMRAELAEPGRQLVSQGSYNGLFTIHGTMMIFLFIAPFGIGLGNYLVPLQIGAPDMAFPRMNAISYWFFAAGGLLILLAGFASVGGGRPWGGRPIPRSRRLGGRPASVPTCGSSGSASSRSRRCCPGSTS